MLESKYIYFCDSCFIEKVGVRADIDPESVNSCIYRKPFSCNKKEQWTRHLSTPKHITNTTMYNNFKDECVSECKYCNVRLDERSYKIHMNRNSKYHLSRQMEYAKESSCNNFILNGRRFHSIEILRAHFDNIVKYSYGEDNKINYTKKHYDLALKIIEDKTEHEIKLNESRKDKERKKMEEYNKKREAKEEKEMKKKELKKLNKKSKPKHENLEMEIEEILEENDKLFVKKMNEKYPKKYEDETPIETAKRERADPNIPPIIDEEDICDECGFTGNFIVEYPEEKLERYGIRICECGGTTTEDESE